VPLVNCWSRLGRRTTSRYSDHAEQLADFSKDHFALDNLFLDRTPPEFSEVNFYDALLATLQRMAPVSGRKAIVLIASGLDTFSKAKYDDALKAARDRGTPVYIIDIGPILRQAVDRGSYTGPAARIDWSRAHSELQEIAKASGGRLYSPVSTFDLSGIYDDIMENLRVRYVISWKLSGTDLTAARSVRIELMNPKTGGPLEISNADGKPVQSKISFEDSFIPRNVMVSRTEARAK